MNKTIKILMREGILADKEALQELEKLKTAELRKIIAKFKKSNKRVITFEDLKKTHQNGLKQEFSKENQGV